MDRAFCIVILVRQYAQKLLADLAQTVRTMHVKKNTRHVYALLYKYVCFSFATTTLNIDGGSNMHLYVHTFLLLEHHCGNACMSLGYAFERRQQQLATAAHSQSAHTRRARSCPDVLVAHACPLHKLNKRSACRRPI